MKIEKLVYGGDGLGRLPAEDGTRQKAVFLPFVLEQEEVEAELCDDRGQFARARLLRVLTPAPARVEPHCPYFRDCGGCHYQHIAYEHQLAAKAAIFRETLRRLGRVEWSGPIETHAAAEWHYRNRTRMRVMRQPVFSLAYSRFGSPELLAVEQCPISSPLINRSLAAINRLGRAGEFPRDISEVEFFADADDAQLILELHCKALPPRKTLQQFYESLRALIPQAAALAAFASAGAHQSSSAALVLGEPALLYRAAGQRYRVSPGSFFQTNRFLTGELISLVTERAGGALALDLYSGVGLFSLPLARSFAKVIAVESAKPSATDLKRNAPHNVTVAAEPVEWFMAHFEPKQLAPEYVVVDPPRAGLGTAVARRLARLGAQGITYVSCDPATLARDLQVLLEGGYAVESVHLVDLFPQTFHIESVVKLRAQR
ncbi:MAG: class I SAM-dependent RNA methyltransferase [Acidobacteria bacterium]|nr:class I SAM-dependent RNA methyltransferase [Acidobacteriota bacterium]